MLEHIPADDHVVMCRGQLARLQVPYDPDVEPVVLLEALLGDVDPRQLRRSGKREREIAAGPGIEDVLDRSLIRQPRDVVGGPRGHLVGVARRRI